MAASDMIQTDIVENGEGRNSCASCCHSLCKRIFPTGFKTEFKEMFALAWPTFLTSLSQFTLQTVSIIMCGHLTKAELDAAGLANSMINVFGLSIGMGMSTACDTLFSQTFGSANKKRVGIYLQRSLIILNSVAVLICCFHINIMPFLIAIGQNPEISMLTANYMLCFLPGIFFNYNFLVTSRYLQDQSIVYPSMICALIGNVVNIVSQYVAIFVLHYGYLASSVCQAASVFIMMIAQFIYIRVSKVYVPTWDGFRGKDALQDWGMFFKLAIPGLFMVALEEWSFEVGTFVAGTISVVQLGIQTVLFQIEAITYMIPLGVSIAVNIRVGQHLGANRPQYAKTSYRVGLALMMIIATIVGILVVSLRNYIPYIFTTEKQIAAGASTVLILNAGFQFSDGISSTSLGALRGCGRQITGAVILFIGYWVLSLPIGISLALAAHMNVLGVWVGLLIGIGLVAIIFFIVVNRTDWQYQAEKAAMVAYGEDKSLNTELQRSYQTIPEDEGIVSGPSHKDTDPLITRRPSRLRRASSSGMTRAITTPAEIEIPEITEIDSSAFRKILIKRGIYVAFIVAIVIGAVIARIVQVTPCYPVNNSSMPHYVGVLPLCNETHPHHLPSDFL